MSKVKKMAVNFGFNLMEYKISIILQTTSSSYSKLEYVIPL